MRINNNIAALNAWRNLTSTDMAVSKSLERLSSGFRINRASDDAAGLAISEKMRGQVKGLNQAIKNSQDGISLIQTAEGALSESHSILQRMRELAVQSSNDTLTNADRAQLQAEVDQLAKEVTRVTNTTEFNTKNLLGGGFQNQTFHIGANQNQTMDVSIGALDANTLGVTRDVTDTATIGGVFTSASVGTQTILENKAYTIDIGAGTTAGTAKLSLLDGTTTLAVVDNVASTGATGNLTFTSGGVDILTVAGSNVGVSGTATATLSASVISKAATVGVNGTILSDAVASGGVDIRTAAFAESSLAKVDKALNDVSTARASLGAFQNRLEHTIANLGAASENLTAAESRIRDVDMASEMASFTRNQILLQAGTAMMAQANQKPQAVLQLLR